MEVIFTDIPQRRGCRRGRGGGSSGCVKSLYYIIATNESIRCFIAFVVEQIIAGIYTRIDDLQQASLYKSCPTNYNTHHTTPHYTHCTAPHNITPHITTQHHTTPHNTIPHHSASQHITEG